MMTTNYIVTILVYIFAIGVTYLIQYCSVISPGFIEFDDRSNKELRLMQLYNKITDKGFLIYLVLVLISILMSYKWEVIVFLVAGLLIQIIYFSIIMSIMTFMYLRSKLYWKRYKL